MDEADRSGFQVIVNSWKDKDKAAAAAAAAAAKDGSVTPRSRHSFMFSRDRDRGDETPGRSRGSSISFKDPRQERRETIEASVSDWAGGSVSKAEKKLKKEKRDHKREEEKKLVKDMGKKLEQEIAKRQKLTQLLEGHKNTVSLLMEQKNLLVC